MSLHQRGHAMAHRYRPTSALSSERLATCTALKVLFMALLASCSRAQDEATLVARVPPISRAAVEAEIERYVCAAWLSDTQLYEVRFSDIRCAEERTSDLSDVAAQA